MDIQLKAEQHLISQERYRNLNVKAQLSELQSLTKDDDTVIGKIYVKNPPEFGNRNKLKSLFGSAILLDERVIGGQGDTTIEMIFAVNNLLIGVVYFAFWRGSFSMDSECNVYRLSKNQTIENINKADKDRIFKSLFS